MAEPWEVEVDGQVFEVEADTPQQAATLARLYAAREKMTTSAQQGAQRRNPELTPGEQMSDRMEKLKTVDPQRERELEMMMRSKEPGAAGAALGLTAAIPAVGGLIVAPGATAASLGAGYLGSKGGQAVGHELEAYGAPDWTSKALGAVGGLGGGLYGGIKGQAILKDLLGAGIGKGSMLGQVIQRLAGTEAAAGGAAVAGETAEEAAKRTALALQRQEADVAAKQALAEARKAQAARIAAKEARDAERHELQKQLLQRRLEGKAPTKSPKPETVQPETPAPPPSKQATAPQEDVLPDEYVSVVPEPKATILPAGTRAPATNLGGKAKPAPPATPEVDLEDVLRRSIEAAKAAKAAKAAEAAGTTSPLRQPRLEIGAQRVGKGVGMTKEEVRMATGPRLDEALGEASPILPDVPMKKIIDTMKALPKTGGAREAYVARATSGKTKWQVENIRRTLEHLGLLAPVAVAGGMAAER